MAQLTVRIPDDLNRALEAAAGRLERKRGEIVRIALRRFLGLEFFLRGGAALIPIRCRAPYRHLLARVFPSLTAGS